MDGLAHAHQQREQVRPGSAVGCGLEREGEPGLRRRVDDQEVGVLADVEVAEELLLSSARAPARVPRNSSCAGSIAVDASPGSLMCTLKQSFSTRGISHSSPAPMSVPDRDRSRPRPTVRRHGIVPLPRNSCEVGQCAIDEPVSASRCSSRVCAVHGVREDAAPPEQALAAAREPGQERPS